MSSRTCFATCFPGGAAPESLQDYQPCLGLLKVLFRTTKYSQVNALVSVLKSLFFLIAYLLASMRNCKLRSFLLLLEILVFVYMFVCMFVHLNVCLFVNVFLLVTRYNRIFIEPIKKTKIELSKLIKRVISARV